MSKRVIQPILGIVAPPRRPLSTSQKEMLRRAGSILSPGQQYAATRRAQREERAEAERRKNR